MLQINNLVVRYGGITAVDGISLQIDQPLVDITVHAIPPPIYE